MTKAELIENVAAEADMTKRQVGTVVELILSEIRKALQKGDRVALTPFGNFVVRQRKAREGRNPKTGATIRIPARRVPAFVAGRALKEALTGSAAAKKGGRKR